MERVYTCWVSWPLSEEISPLPAEGFMVPQTYNQPWGTFPLLSCIWCTLGVRVFRSLLSPVEYGWYLDMTCLCLVLLCNCGLFWGCLGIRALAGIIGLVGVASQWNLAGNHQFFFVDQHQAETPPPWVHSTKGKSEDITEWEQKAAGGAGWNASVLWGRKRFSEEASKNICASSAKEQQVGWCVSEADCPHV